MMHILRCVFGAAFLSVKVTFPPVRYGQAQLSVHQGGQIEALQPKERKERHPESGAD